MKNSKVVISFSDLPMPSTAILLVAFFIGIAPNISFAQTRFIKIGGNYSYLKSPSYSDPGINYMYGIGKDWKLYRWIQLRTELLITNSSTALNDRSVQPSVWVRDFPHLPNEVTRVDYYNIDVQLRYLEIPLLLRVEKSLKKNLGIGLEIGYSLRLFPKDASKTTRLREIESTDLTEEERQNFLFDYRFTGTGEDYSFRGRRLRPTFGAYVDYLRFQVGLRYQADNVDGVSSIVIGNDVPLRIFVLSMGYQF